MDELFDRRGRDHYHDSMELNQEVSSYIASFPKEVQTILLSLRKLVLDTAPEAIESFAYMMPAYKLNGKPLVYFAAFPKHIGVYATPSSHSAFAQQLKKYKTGKGSVQFPLSEPLPLDLIGAMIAFKRDELNVEAK